MDVNAQLPEQISFNGNSPQKNCAETPPDWRAVLAKALSESKEGTKAAVAKVLDVSRPYVSRVMSEGKSRYEPPPEFIAKVLDRFYMVAACPHNGLPQPASECRSIAMASAPTHHPHRMALWKSCQRCPHKPAIKEKP